MTMKEKQDIRPLLVKVGVALAVSFAGFLYSWMQTRRTKPPQPSSSPYSLDQGCENEVGGDRTCPGDDFHVVKRISSSGSITSISAERCISVHQEDSCVIKVAVDNSVVSPSSRHSGNKDVYLLPEFNDLVKELDFGGADAGNNPRKDLSTLRPIVETPRAVRGIAKDDTEQEIRRLRNMVRVLRERERNLEIQLLEFYGLKEQEAAVMELQNRLNINNMEAKFLSLKIEALQAENHRLQAQVVEHAKVVSELDSARAKIKLLKKNLRSEAEENKEQILSLKRRVSVLHEQDVKAVGMDSEMKLNLQRLTELEIEAEELRNSNSKLHVENSELASRLESTQILANSVLHDPETEELRELGDRLRQENEVLTKEVERLQSDCCSNVEELVYLRWINACLRYELRNFQPMDGRTVARDLSKSLSPKSEQKAKQLIVEYANSQEMEEKSVNVIDFELANWSSSQNSYMSDSGDLDDSPAPSKADSSRKTKFISKLMRLVHGKDIIDHNRSSPVNRACGTDGDSPQGDFSTLTETDSISDLQSKKVQSFLYSSRNSVESQRFASLDMDDMKDIESGLRRSEAGSSRQSLDYQRFRSLKVDGTKDTVGEWRSRSSSASTGFSSSRRSGSHFSVVNALEQDLDSIEKSDLAKFAEALKGSGSGRQQKPRKKSVSLGSLLM